MDYEKLLRYRTEKNPFARRLGMVVDKIGPGTARARMTVTPQDANPLGYAHGGVYMALADAAAGTAASTHGYKAVTVDAAWHFYRGAVPGDTLYAEAEELKAGQTICVYDVRLTDQRGRLLGSGTFTFFLLDELLNLD